jgi:hypothetical protein
MQKAEVRIQIHVGWGCSSVAEHLPSIHEARGSVPSTTKKKKKKIYAHDKVPRLAGSKENF